MAKKKTKRKSGRLVSETPNLPNEQTIQELLAVHSMRNDQIMDILLMKPNNVDCIIDTATEKRAQIIERMRLEFEDDPDTYFDEPSNSERVEYCKEQIARSSNPPKAIETWGKFYRGGKMIKKSLPEYFKLRNQRLSEQIRRGRHQELLRRARSTGFASKGGGLVHDIAEVDVERMQTGMPEIDILFGANLDEPDEFGIPRGISVLLGGEYGVGKTRLLVYVSALMSHPKVGGRVLYQQGEMDADIFYTNYVKNVLTGDKSEDLHIFGDITLADHLDRLYTVEPDLVIIDSYQMIREATNENGTERVHKRLRAACNDINASVIFISHLNAQGEIKGGTKLPHMVDVVMTAKKLANPQQFRLSVPKKNRFGATGTSACFEHGKTRVIPFTPGSRSLTTGKTNTVTVRRPQRTIDGDAMPEVHVPRMDAQGRNN